MFEDLDAVFQEGIRNENYVYGCYFVSNIDASKVDSVFNSLHFERIALSSDYMGTPAQACESLRSDMEETEGEIAKIDERIEELMTRQALDFRSEKTPGGVV